MDFDVCPAFFAGRDVSDLPFQLFRHLRITAALTDMSDIFLKRTETGLSVFAG